MCPFVGLPLPHYPTQQHLKRAWFVADPRSWYIRPFRRRAIYRQLARNLDEWGDWLRMDSTPTFYAETSRLKRDNDGAVIGIAGPKGSGKSVLGQMVLTRCVTSTPHVLFQYKDFDVHVKDMAELDIGVIIDEDLRATGQESRNLVVHVNNAFETSRKAELWAICTGVNLNFDGWGDTLDLRLIPYGYNVRYQATRAAVWSKDREFLGLIVLTRKHRPEDSVLYYDSTGIWGQYKARAIAYSRDVLRQGGVTEAVDAESQTKHIETLKQHLRDEYLDHDRPLPKDLLCRRIYRQARLPAKSISYMQEVIAWAKEELEEERAVVRREVIETSREGFDGLRDMLTQLILNKGGTPRQAEKAVAWYVPDWPLKSESQVGEDLGVSRDAIQKAKKRGLADVSPTELGDIGERWLASHIDSPAGARTAGGTKSRPDILLEEEGVAVNVKLSLEKSFRRRVETTPEDQWAPRAVLALVMARRLELRLFPITGPETSVNSGEGVLCAPERVYHGITEVLGL